MVKFIHAVLGEKLITVDVKKLTHRVIPPGAPTNSSRIERVW